MNKVGHSAVVLVWITGVLGQVILHSQTPPEKPPAPPVISFEHQAEFYRADGQMVRAQAAVAAAQKELQEATIAVIADCGDKFAPGQDPGNPKKLACVPKGGPGQQR